MEKTDIIIIGAGVIGLAIAARLSAKYSVIISEKENKIGQHTSSRNSEVLHSGIYYKPNSLKAKLCVKGNKDLKSFASRNNIEVKEYGKNIIAQGIEKEDLYDLFRNGQANGIKNLEYYQNGYKNNWDSIFVPSTAVIDVHSLMKQLLYIAEDNGAFLALNSEIKSIEGNVITDSNDDQLAADMIINSAGLWADKVAKLAGVDKYKQWWCKGEYYKTTKFKNMPHLIYPLPTKHSLGIHSKMDLEGNVSFGPSNFPIDKVDYTVYNEHKKQFHKELSQWLNIDIDDLEPDFAGIRPKFADDFIISKDTEHLINLIGIESPGLTCSTAIAEYVERIL